MTESLIDTMFGAKHGVYIASAYGVTAVVILALVLWTLLTARAHRKRLEQLERE